MKKMLFIFNPHSGGSARLKTRLMEILSLYAEEGYELTVYPTSAPGDAHDKVAKQGQKYDIVVCCGGDGTLNETVEGALECDKPPRIGYIPSGTTNDFATSHGIPKNNVMAAARRVIRPKEIFKSDIGLFNDRIFTYVAAFGAFTDVSYTTKQSVKNMVGYFAYLMEAVSKLPNLKPTKIRVEGEGMAFEEEFLLGMVSNSYSVAGVTFPPDAGVELDDGHLEMLLVRQPHDIFDMGELSGALVTKNLDSRGVTLLRVKDCTITTEKPLAWSLDGENGGEHTEAHIRVANKAIEICI